MAGELIRVYHGSNPVTLEANGGSCAAGAIVAANDATLDLASYGDMPNVTFVLAAAFGTAPTENGILELVARLIDIDGTNDAEVPEASRTDRIVGRFVMNNVTSTQYAACDVYDAPRKADYYLVNRNTGQTLSAGWTLKANVWSVKAA